MPEISVIITTYKGSNHLGRAIDSVLNQTFSNFEIIIVDDNDPSSEERKKTEMVVIDYLNNMKNYRIFYIKHKQNKNGAAARNTGIHKAQGKYIAFLDDDDFYMPERLEKCYAKLEAMNVNSVYTSVVYANDSKITGVKCATQKGKLFNELLLDENLLGTGSNLFIKRESILKLGGFDERYRRNQDYEFMLRYFREEDIEVINEFLVVKSTNGTINIPPFDKMLETKKMILDVFSEQIDKLNENQKYIFQRNIVKSLLLSAFIYCNNNDIKKAEEIGKEWGIKLDLKDKIKKFLVQIHLYKTLNKKCKSMIKNRREVTIGNLEKEKYIERILKDNDII